MSIEKTNYKIVSDGTPHGTSVFDRDGKELRFMERVDIFIDHTGVHASLKLYGVELELSNVPATNALAKDDDTGVQVAGGIKSL